ncbi:MAG: phage tail sheath C-terminal domain-containing protein [Pseudomonadota bacterium]
MVAGRRLPGIHVDTAPPAFSGGQFPRMDVAVFVGIAERGPCHRPVLIESVAAFEAAFGRTVDLAFDPSNGTMLTAHLAPSVRAFFSNGGEQCWVIRVAWTEKLTQAWANAGSDVSDVTPAATGRFAVPGLLGRYPFPSTGESTVEIGELMAASAGAWSSSLSLEARALRQPVPIQNPQSHRWGMRFSCRADLQIGDLLELNERDVGILRYAKIVHSEGQQHWAAWSSSFQQIREEAASKEGHAYLSNRRNRVTAEFFEGPTSRIEFSSQFKELTPKTWIMFFRQGEAIWLRADEVESMSAQGPAWQQVGSRLPETPFIASRLSLDIRSGTPEDSQIVSAIGLTPEASNSLFMIEGDDAAYKSDHNRSARSRPQFASLRGFPKKLEAFRNANAGGIGWDELVRAFVDETALESQRPILRTAFIPLGIDGAFGPGAHRYEAENERALELSGLTPFDHRIFIDPAFAATSAQEIDRQAIQRHDLDGQALFGIHAAYDIPGESVGEASILAAPDAAQPGWREQDDATAFPSPDPGTFVPPTWYDHSGPCLAEANLGDTDTPIQAPDFGRFLDSTVAVLARPRLGVPTLPVIADHFSLSFSSNDENVEFVLEESTSHDFLDAAEIYRGTGNETVLTDRSEGVFYYRLRTERDGNVSQFAARSVTVRRSDYTALPSEPDTTRRVHVAMLRLAAGSAAMTALLSLPREFRANDAQSYASQLVVPGFGDTALTGRERRALSYGGIFHPWIAGGAEDTLITTPPEGAVAGQMARIARENGAWYAPANREFTNVVGLYPAIAPEDWLPSDAARINLILPRPDGFFAHAARSLSGDPDWNQISVRRLFIMLRRMLLTLGNTFLFEPNGPAVRRSIERTLTSHLDLLQRRGAFSGRISSDSYFIRLRSTSTDRSNGRILADIGIAPSHPLEFIEMSLVQQGERLTLEEAA